MKEREFRVLIVEDDRASAELLRNCLSRRGIAAGIAVDGNEAVDRCRHEAWDAVILDLLIPGANGFEVMREIAHFRPELLERTVVVTGAGHGTLAGFDRSRVRALMRKPLNLDALVAELEQCRQRGIPAPAAPAISTRGDLQSVLDN